MLKNIFSGGKSQNIVIYHKENLTLENTYYIRHGILTHTLYNRGKITAPKRHVCQQHSLIELCNLMIIFMRFNKAKNTFQI